MDWFSYFQEDLPLLFRLVRLKLFQTVEDQHDHYFLEHILPWFASYGGLDF